MSLASQSSDTELLSLSPATRLTGTHTHVHNGSLKHQQCEGDVSHNQHLGTVALHTLVVHTYTYMILIYDTYIYLYDTYIYLYDTYIFI